MGRKHFFPTTVLALILLAGLAGCDSHAMKKEVMVSAWEESTAKAKIPIAEEYLQNERFGDAGEILDEILNNAPQLAEAHLLMGKLHLSQARLNEAHKYLQQAVKLDRSLDQAWFHLALIAQHHDNDVQAQVNYNRALKLKPGNIDYILALARTLCDQNNYEDALTLLQSKTEILPSESQINVAIANVYLWQGSTEKAIAMYKQALFLDPQNTQITESLGYCCIISKRWDLGP